MIKYPFTIEDVDITLFFVDSKGNDLDDPYIGIAKISSGQLIYKVMIENEGIPSCKERFVESYDEALKEIEKL